MKTYKPGDKVRIVNHSNPHWSCFGLMDKYMNEILTIQEVFPETDGSHCYKMAECPEFLWADNDFVEEEGEADA